MLAAPKIASVVLVTVGARADAARNRGRHPRRRQLDLDRCRGPCKPATPAAKSTPATTDKPSAGRSGVEQRRQAPRGLRESVGLVAARGAEEQRVLGQGHVREAVDGACGGPDEEDGDAPVGGGQAKGALVAVAALGAAAARAAAAAASAPEPEPLLLLLSSDEDDSEDDDSDDSEEGVTARLLLRDRRSCSAAATAGASVGGAPRMAARSSAE